jgi:hypothetical protein
LPSGDRTAWPANPSASYLIGIARRFLASAGAHCACWQHLRRALRAVVRGFGQKDAEPASPSKDRFRKLSDGQCEQPNHPDYEDCECYGIIVEPMLLLCVHDLKPSLERVRGSRPNAAKAVTWVTGKWPNLRRGDHLNRGRRCVEEEINPLGPTRFCTRLPSETEHEWWSRNAEPDRLTGSLLLPRQRHWASAGFGWCGAL